MVRPEDVPRVLSDAARLLGSGRLIVFGSAALAMRLKAGPAARHVDVWCEPPERGDLITALMGELSWYQETHDVYVEVWAAETFAAPEDWRERAETLTNDDHPGVTLLVPHPHDVLVSKLERWEAQDREHAAAVLAAFPPSRAGLQALAARAPYGARIADPERIARFRAHTEALAARLERR